MIFMMQILLIVGGVGLPSQSAWDDEPRRVEFTTSDGVQIVGDFYLPKKPVEKLPAVILLHMYDSNRRAWDTLAPELQKAGLAVLAIDLRGHGESIQPANLQLETKAKNRDAKLFQNMWKDVEAAYRWLARRPEVDPSRLAIVGASVGCSVALDYAARDKSIDLLVLLSPGVNYLGLDSTADIRKYAYRPILMLSPLDECPTHSEALIDMMLSNARQQFPDEISLLEKPKAQSLTEDGIDVQRFYLKVDRAVNFDARCYARPNIHGTQMFG